MWGVCRLRSRSSIIWFWWNLACIGALWIRCVAAQWLKSTYCEIHSGDGSHIFNIYNSAVDCELQHIGSDRLTVTWWRCITADEIATVHLTAVYLRTHAVAAASTAASPLLLWQIMRIVCCSPRTASDVLKTCRCQRPVTTQCKKWLMSDIAWVFCLSVCLCVELTSLSLVKRRSTLLSV